MNATAWTKFYPAFATKLLTYKNNRNELIDLIKNIYVEAGMKLPTLEKDNNIVDIDPFTIFALFNKGITHANRIKILKGIKSTFDIHADVPETFDGIPVVNPMHATFYHFIGDREENDIDNLWTLFEVALTYADYDNETNKQEFIKYFDVSISQKSVSWNITMGLYWIRPFAFINLDATNRKLLENNSKRFENIDINKVLKKVPSGEMYLNIMDNVKTTLTEYESFPALSYDAWIQASENKTLFWGEDKSLDFWPSLEEYNPNLTKEDWKKYILEIEMPNHPSPMRMLKGMMELGGDASCKKLSEVYGGHPTAYIGCAFNLGRRAKKYFNLPPCMEGENERFFSIPFLGKWTENTKEDYYIYRIRPELFEALKEIDMSNISPYYKDDGSCQNYWWLNANPKIWSFSNLKPGEEQGYTLYNERGNKRRVFQYFLDAKEGDLVIGYESTPVKQIVALAVVSKENDGEQLYFKKTEGLAVPIDFSEFKDCPELANMEYILQPQGSLFKLTKEEYEFLLDMILEANGKTSKTETSLYSEQNFLEEVFVDKTKYNNMRSLLSHKKNIILQGAPGVGKTFAAKRLAYSIMGEKDDDRIEFVQFHQSYSYEDFIMGYKPSGNGFELKYGIFYSFCQKAANHPDKEFFFIIDEINRGNMSKIFGELLMLIENDYRGEKATLAYNGLKFSVPENLYIIGMMNTADRSLAMIDYALRRRFSFIEMTPGFDDEGFKKHQNNFNNETFNKLIERIKELNIRIKEDASLGSGFCIGHSHFCRKDINNDVLKEIVEYDIIPTLNEYWFDDLQKASEWANKLIGVFND